jgi:hypothetical protein
MRRWIGKPLFVFSNLLKLRFQTLDDFRILFDVPRVGADERARIALQALGCLPQAVENRPRHPTGADLPDRPGPCYLVVGLHIGEDPFDVGLTDRT